MDCIPLVERSVQFKAAVVVGKDDFSVCSQAAGGKVDQQSVVALDVEIRLPAFAVGEGGRVDKNEVVGFGVGAEKGEDLPASKAMRFK